MSATNKESIINNDTAATTTTTVNSNGLPSDIQQAESLIKKLQKDLVEQRVAQQRDQQVVEEKTARIKQWVTTRLHELELQNEKLRSENQRCSKQLKLLQNCAEKTAYLRTTEVTIGSKFMSKSVAGYLPTPNSTITMSDSVTATTAPSLDRILPPVPVDQGSSTDGDEDSGTTSDLNEAADFYDNRTKMHQMNGTSLMSQSLNARLHAGHNKENWWTSRSNPGSPKWLRKSRLNKVLGSGDDKHRTHSLPRHHQKKKKPVPMPRRCPTEPKAYLVNDDLLMIERDSLQHSTYGDSTVTGMSDSTFGRLCTTRDSLTKSNDYVNIQELQYMMGRCKINENTTTSEDSPPPPEPPKHRQMPAWEAKLHQLADQCLTVTGTCANDRLSIARDSSAPDQYFATSRSHSGARIVTGANEHGYWRSSQERTTSADSGKLTGKDSSSDRIQLPMFTTRHGHGGQNNNNSKPTSSSSSCGEHGKWHQTRLDLDSPQPGTSGDCRSSGSSNVAVKKGSGNSGHYASTRIGQTRTHRVKHSYKRSTDLGAGSSSDDEADYAVPPDADNNQMNVVQSEAGMQISLIAEPCHIEKSGYLMNVSDNRMKSLKRRWCVLKFGELALYKSQKDEHKEPLAKFSVADISSVTRIDNKSGVGMEIIVSSSTYRFTAESRSVTEEWIKVLNRAMKAQTTNALMSNSDICNEAQVSGWLTRVKCGQSKRCYAVLTGTKLMFFKSPAQTSGSSHMCVHGAHIHEATRSSDDSSSDETGTTSKSKSNNRPKSRNNNKNGGIDLSDPTTTDSTDFTICVQLTNQQPVYLVFPNMEDKERWMYHLKVASNAGQLYGTAFEVLVQRLMSVGGGAASTLWEDVLIATVDQPPTQTMVTVANDNAKDALALAKSCHLFSTVPMLTNAIQYHVDLAQNTLAQALKNDDMRNELFAQLIRLSNCPAATGMQAWKLLALAVSLFIPTQYALLWLLRKHLMRWTCMGGDESTMALFCQQALDRCLANGARCERPSKLETTSLLTRNPTSTQLPHSLAMCLPDARYTVVTFDGSSTVAECLSQLCNAVSVRQPPICGYALYADDPHDNTSCPVLNSKQKICDVISRWEQQLADCKSGKVPRSRMIQIQMKRRFYWPLLSQDETEAEKLLLAHECALGVQNGSMPVSPELAEELCALFAQMTMCNHVSDDIERLNEALNRFYPERLLQMTSRGALHNKLSARWSELHGLRPNECARTILSALRRWPFFGAVQFTGAMRWRQDERVRLAVNDVGVHLLNAHNLDLICSYPFASVLSFGGYHDDFMLTVSRPPSAANPDEPAKERLTFSMQKTAILQLTLLIADYIKTRRQISSSAPTRDNAAMLTTPRRYGKERQRSPMTRNPYTGTLKTARF